MLYDRALILGKLNRWEKYLDGFNLPTWEELPAFEVYMDQVILLIRQYLNFLPQEEYGETLITSSAVNNYVRLRLMPPPHKKRYGRIHIAYLVMICTLKQSLTMADVQKLLPIDQPEDVVRQHYNDYVRKHKSACLYFIDEVRQESQMVLHADSPQEESVESFVSTIAILSGLSRLLTEKLLHLQHMTGPADAPRPIQEYDPK